MTTFEEARENAEGWEWSATEHDKDIWNAALDRAAKLAKGERCDCAETCCCKDTAVSIADAIEKEKIC